MNYAQCSLFLKSFPILFISTMFVVLTSAAYNHHKLSVLSVRVFWVFLKATELFIHLCHGIVLYPPPQEAFILTLAEVGFMHTYV